MSNSYAATGDIDSDWRAGLAIWAVAGRIEDYPRNVRLPKYAPSPAKQLGKRFAEAYRDEYAFLIARLDSRDPVERLCAFECLEYMAWNFPADAAPAALLRLPQPLPPVVLNELSGDADAEGFDGATVGEWFAHVFGGRDD